MHGHSAGKIKNTMYDKNCETGHQSWAMGFTKQNLESSPHLNFISLWRIFLLFFSFLSDNYIISIPFGKYTANWNGWKWGGSWPGPIKNNALEFGQLSSSFNAAKKKKKRKERRWCQMGTTQIPSTDYQHQEQTHHPSIRPSIHPSIDPSIPCTILLFY